MAAKILRHRQLPNGSYALVVWTDDTKQIDGEPDPTYVRRFEWGAKPEGVTADEWQEFQLREARALIQQENAQRGTGTALPTEGTSL